jgi:hypothetical protein
MHLTQWQSWHGLFTHIVSPRLRRVSLASPRSLTSPDRGSVSRRSFMQGTAGAAGLALAAAHWTPVQAEHPSRGEPLPIPTVDQTPFEPIHAADPTMGQDPSLITDFQGVAGTATLSLTGVGTDTTADQTARYGFKLDVSFMQGEFIGADGQHHQGSFAFI